MCDEKKGIYQMFLHFKEKDTGLDDSIGLLNSKLIFINLKLPWFIFS